MSKDVQIGNTQGDGVTPASLGFSAKGDLVSLNASGQIAALGRGLDGQVLTADSAETLGLVWSTAVAGAKVTEIPVAIVGFNQTLPVPSAADVYVQEIMLTANADISLGTPPGSPSWARFIMAITPNADGITPTLGQSGATIKTPNSDQPLISEVNGDTTLWVLEWFDSCWHLVNVIINEGTV